MEIKATPSDSQNLSLDIAALIKQKIIDGEMNLGERIVETKLARELGISQTPIRDTKRNGSMYGQWSKRKDG